jgi:hypothetical protein
MPTGRDEEADLAELDAAGAGFAVQWSKLDSMSPTQSERWERPSAEP